MNRSPILCCIICVYIIIYFIKTNIFSVISVGMGERHLNVGIGFQSGNVDVLSCIFIYVYVCVFIHTTRL